MPDDVTRAEKGKWFSELLIAQEKVAEEYKQKFIGKTYRVLCDDYSEKQGYMTGHTNGTAVIEFPADENMLGKFVNVYVESYDNGLCGKII